MRDFSAFPVLWTDRLVLRRMTDDDLPELHRMRADPAQHLHTDTIPDLTVAETEEYLRRIDRGIDRGDWILWAVCARADGRFLGTVSLWNFADDDRTAELGFGLAKAARGAGFMTEAVARVVAFGFAELALRRIEGWTEAANAEAAAVLHRLGFRVERTVDEAGTRVKRVFRMVVHVRIA